MAVISKKQTTGVTQQAQNPSGGSANRVASALKQQQAQQPASPSDTLRTDMSTPSASPLPGNAQSAQATPLVTVQKPTSTANKTVQTQTPAQPQQSTQKVTDPNQPYQTKYTDENGNIRTGYIINGTTYTDAEGKNPVGVGSVVTDQSGREWIKTENGSMRYEDFMAQNGMPLAPSTQPVTNPNQPFQTTYVDANGQTQTGYIINGVTYTDAAGRNPVGTGSIVTDQSGRKWIKTENGSMLYSEWLAQQQRPSVPSTTPGVQQQEPELTVPEREESSTDYAANLRKLLAEWQKAAQDGATAQIDYATLMAVTQLERALADAQPQFKAQQDQIAADKQMAQDNAALYAEMRGDKGGIGQAQYNAIANAAAINRQTVASQQTKLSTDTARQIADLRARGEFDKADKMLEITQTYLSQLMSIEQWGMEFGLTVDQFNEAIRQWEAEYQLALEQFKTSKEQWEKQFAESIRQWEADYEMGVAGLTGMFNGQLTLDGREQISDVAAALLDAGVQLSDAQLYSLGMTREQADAYVAAQQAAASGGGGRGGTPATPQEPALIGTDAWYQQLYNTYGENAGNMLKYYYKDLDISSQSLAEDAWKGYSNWLGKQKYGSKSEYDKTGLGDTNSDFLALQAQVAARKQEGYSNQSIRNLISDAYSAQKISLAQRNMLLAMYP